MSAAKKRPARARPAAVSRSTPAAPSKRRAEGKPARDVMTAVSVAARLLALPQTEGANPALWRKADFGGELAPAEKPHLDAALTRLRADRQIVALSYGKTEYFAFAGALGERLAPVPAPAADESTPDLMDVYRRLVRESGGFPDVKISQLARALGPAAARALPERLLALWRTGDATLSLGDWSLASEETRAAAVEMDGEKYLLVRIGDV